MKINPFDTSIPIQKNAEKIQKKEATDGRDFRSILIDHLKPFNSEAIHKTMLPHSPVGIANVSVDPLYLKNDAIQNLSSLLDTLEGYQRGLSDGSVSLRILDHDVKRMVDLKQKLSSLSNSLPEGDKLKEIVSEALIVASIEIERFNAGYYV